MTGLSYNEARIRIEFKNIGGGLVATAPLRDTLQFCFAAILHQSQSKSIVFNAVQHPSGCAIL